MGCTRTICEILLTLLVINGCSVERPTRAVPAAAPPLPAWDPFRDPVIGSGPIVRFVATNESTLVCSLSAEGFGPGNLDLRIVYDPRIGYPRANLFIHDWSGDSLVALDLRHPTAWDDIGAQRRLRAFVSSSHLSVEQVMSKEAGEIILRSKDLSGRATAQILSLDPKFRRVPLPLNCYDAAVAALGDALWVFQRAWDYNPGYRDSICVYSLSGERMWALPCPFDVWSMEWSSRGLWVMHHSSPIMFTLCDSTLDVLGEFSLPANGDKFLAGIMIRRDEFWLYDRYVHSFLRIDADSSLLSGAAVIIDSVAPENPPGFWGDAGVADDRFLYVQTYSGGGFPVRAYNTLGRFVYEFPGISAQWDMTWDGEAFWTVNNGHGGANADQLGLYRFAVPF